MPAFARYTRVPVSFAAMPTSSCQRRVVLYSGHVQGVGFRYTTHHIAAGYAVTGYVRTLRDGRVELAAEGDASSLDEFLSAVRRQFSGHIQDEACDSLPATGEFTRFDIRT